MKKSELIKLTKKTITSLNKTIKGFEGSVMVWNAKEDKIHDYIDRHNNMVITKARLEMTKVFLRHLNELED